MYYYFDSAEERKEGRKEKITGQTNRYKYKCGPYLDVCFSLRHGPKVLQDLVAEAGFEVLEPGIGLLIHLIMQLL